RRDLADVDLRTPVQAEAKNDVTWLELATRCDIAEGTAQSPGGRDAVPRGGRLRPCSLRQEERDDTVADVTADEPVSIDDAAVGWPDEAASEIEVAGSGETSSEWGRRLEVGEEDGCGPPSRLRDALHTFEVPQVSANRDRRENCHPDAGFRDEGGPGEL